MFNIQYDPVTTQLVIGRKRKKSTVVISDGTSATLSPLVVTTYLELLINNLNVIDYIEITENGIFSVYLDGAVELR